MKRVALKLKNKIAESRGALTVEASLAFPVVISLFLLLFLFLRFACINIAINHAVNETAKQIAAAGYSITFLNDIEDEVISESGFVIPDFESENKDYSNFKNTSDRAVSLLSNFITGDFEAQDVGNVLKDSILKICGDYKRRASSYITQQVAGTYYKLKTDLKYAAIGHLLEKHCQNSCINYENIKIIFADIPKSNAEHEMKMRDRSYLDVCSAIGYTPQQNDVVIAVEYSTKTTIPFFGSKTIVTRHIAVEKAWVKGNNAFASIIDAIKSLTESDGVSGNEKNNNVDPTSTKKESIVYVTKTGIRYHENGCRYLSKSKIPMSLTTAKEKGYTPCKVCHNLR